MKRLLFFLLLFTGTAHAQFIVPPGVSHDDFGTMAYEDKDDYLDLRTPVDPVFFIPNQPGAAWTDFEFKGSANNFTSHAVPGTFYWFHSPNPQHAAQYRPASPFVYFTITGGPSQGRGWLAQDTTGTASIFDIVTAINPSAYVTGWLVIVQGLGLTRADFTHWAWTYCLMDGLGHERIGTDPVWRITFPVGYLAVPDP